MIFRFASHAGHSGSSQSAYLIREEKTVLMDTVRAPHQFEFLQNLESEIDLDKIDFIVVNHGETIIPGVFLP